MKWKKLGKIFDPTINAIGSHLSFFAKSPQALVFDSFVRIYFCAHRKTDNGKYLSYPSYVDFNKDLTKILGISENPVIQLGQLGAFDEHGIFPLSPLKHGDMILAYTTGWSRRVSVSIDMSIGLAISKNGGKFFEKFGQGGPIITANNSEPFLVGDAFVKFYNNAFHMWYIFGDCWKKLENQLEAERFYRIAHAVSVDGINWKRNSIPVIEKSFEDECQAHPTVFYADNKYHMYFCFRNAYNFRANQLNSYKIGYAYSSDLINWVRDDSNSGIGIEANSWDSEMMCYPNVFELNDKFYLLYNGNDFGKFGFGIAVLENV